MTSVRVGGLLATVVLMQVLLPRILFPLERVQGTFLDRLIAGAVLITALNVAAMYVLGALGMLELLGLIGVWGVTWWLVKGRRTRRPRRSAAVTLGLLRACDVVETEGRRSAIRMFSSHTLGRWATSLGGRARAAWEQRPGPASLLTSAAIIAVLIGAGALRYSRALNHVDLVPQDSWLALSWTTFLNQGRILADGIYPQGAYMWMSALDRFYPFGLFNFVRYAGPLMNTLELLVLYWVVSRATASRVAGLLSIAVFGFFAGHPALLVVWNRQIGAMSQEFALAFALMALVFGCRYMNSHRPLDLVLAAASLFVAATSNALVIPLLAMGFGAIIVVGLITGAWRRQALTRLVLVGLAAIVAANLYFLLGALRGTPLALSFDLYNPANRATFSETEFSGSTPELGAHLAGNPIYRMGTAGAVLGVLAGAVVLRKDRERGRTLLTISTISLAAMLIFDLVLWQTGVLFRVRQGWITATLMTIGLGLGVGALVLLAATALERARARGWQPGWSSTVALEGGALVVAALLFFSLWPQYSAAARSVGPSGYPAATSVGLELLAGQDALRFTFVGVSEQYQQAIEKGFFTEAWVFGRDITFSDAKDPAYELEIPTPNVFIFAEKVAFAGPQSRPYGPTQEYYRNHTVRSRIMSRITGWCETYRSTHHDMDVVYDDPTLTVYRIRRDSVNVQGDLLSPRFKDYKWQPGQIFDEDGDITADIVVPNPEAAIRQAGRT